MIVKFCMLLETKGPRQQTKFNPQSGRGLRSRDHFYNFSERSSNLICSQKLMGRCDSQNLTPKVGVAYDQVSVHTCRRRP